MKLASYRNVAFGLIALSVLSLSLQRCFAQDPNASLAKPLVAASADNRTAGNVSPSIAKTATVHADRYVIGPNDVLSIDVWKVTELTRVLPVRPDGQISLPLVGDLQASGLTPHELQASLTEKLGNYFERPSVTVIVQQANSHQFNVMGEVQRPGAYPMTKPMTVLDALAQAGGFRDFAKEKKIYVLRLRRDGSAERIPFNYREVIKGEHMAQNIQLRPNDTVIVP